jgi:D-alanyl-lipoteichoic acid acyltransferase DltB (MBOAT superfamily)
MACTVLFPTIQFGIFFPLVFVGCWLLRPYSRRWKLFILVASYIFYGWWDWHYCLLLAVVTVANQIVVIGIAEARSHAVKRFWLTVGITADIGILGYFKYYNFFAQSVTDGFAKFGVHISPQLRDIVLPIGVSFFTFQAMSYVIDAYRDNLRPVSLLDFAVYISFFPHLVAGPIVRAVEFLPQMRRRADPRHIEASRAFRLIVAGMFKKVVISSFLASTIVDKVFAAPNTHSSLEVLLGIYGYAMQIYADFSGYTDIAIGCALLLGIRFPPNFDSPYRSLSLQEFWRRWHITLSRWLRDYLYISLGGNRKGRWKTYRNLMLTMLIGGLWHGASWTFVVWGGIHGVGLAVERLMADRRAALGLAEPADTMGRRFLRGLVTFNIVCLAWVFFRAPTFTMAWDVLGRLFTGWGEPSPAVSLLLILVLVGMLACQFVPELTMERVQVAFSNFPVVAQGVTLGGCFFLIDALGPTGVAPFIYFRF